jgi:hypothetical protein
MGSGARRRQPVSPLEAMPEWMRSLKGFDQLTLKRADSGERPKDDTIIAKAKVTEGGRNGGTWRIAIAMPEEIAEAAERIDPLLFLPGLAGAVAQLESRIGEIVRYCRANDRSWSQIGEALSVSKQAAWERYSGEE